MSPVIRAKSGRRNELQLLTRDEFNAFCGALPHTTHVVQWGNSDVWKIGGKVFTVGGTGKGEPGYSMSFKTSEIGFEVLRDKPGCRPAPYLASRGMKWIQRLTGEAVSDEEVKEHIEYSYRLVAKGLTKKLQKELGFLD